MVSPTLKQRARAVFALCVGFVGLALWREDGSLDAFAESLARTRRGLSIHLGGGDCAYRPAIQWYDEGFPTYGKLWKTIVAGYPSGDKRLTFLQLEGLTGLSARDEVRRRRRRRASGPSPPLSDAPLSLALALSRSLSLSLSRSLASGISSSWA